jgi:hypothetical protein
MGCAIEVTVLAEMLLKIAKGATLENIACMLTFMKFCDRS